MSLFQVHYYALPIIFIVFGRFGLKCRNYFSHFNLNVFLAHFIKLRIIEVYLLL